MAVLASLGGRHLNDLAGSPFQQYEAILTQGRALHGVGGGCPGITRLEVQICVCHVCCLEVNKTKATKYLLELIELPTLKHKNVSLHVNIARSWQIKACVQELAHFDSRP